MGALNFHGFCCQVRRKRRLGICPVEMVKDQIANGPADMFCFFFFAFALRCNLFCGFCSSQLVLLRGDAMMGWPGERVDGNGRNLKKMAVVDKKGGSHVGSGLGRGEDHHFLSRDEQVKIVLMPPAFRRFRGCSCPIALSSGLSRHSFSGVVRGRRGM
jgi:hypothetical protein